MYCSYAIVCVHVCVCICVCIWVCVLYLRKIMSNNEPFFFLINRYAEQQYTGDLQQCSTSLVRLLSYFSTVKYIGKYNFSKVCVCMCVCCPQWVNWKLFGTRSQGPNSKLSNHTHLNLAFNDASLLTAQNTTSLLDVLSKMG